MFERLETSRHRSIHVSPGCFSAGLGWGVDGWVGEWKHSRTAGLFTRHCRRGSKLLCSTWEKGGAPIVLFIYVCMRPKKLCVNSRQFLEQIVRYFTKLNGRAPPPLPLPAPHGDPPPLPLLSRSIPPGANRGEEDDAATPTAPPLPTSAAVGWVKRARTTTAAAPNAVAAAPARRRTRQAFWSEQKGGGGEAGACDGVLAVGRSGQSVSAGHYTKLNTIVAAFELPRTAVAAV